MTEAADLAPIALDDGTVAHAPLYLSDAVPRLSAESADVLRRLTTLVGRPGFRAGKIDYLLEWRHAFTGRYAVHYRLKVNGEPGALALDREAQMCLLGESAPELLPVEVQYVLLAEAAQDLLAILRDSAGVNVEFDVGLPDNENTDVPWHELAHFALTGQGHTGHGHGALRLGGRALAMPAPARNQALPAPASRWMRRLRVPLTFVVGSTSISLSELRSVTRGDIVSIERWQSAGKSVVLTAGLRGVARDAIGVHGEGKRLVVYQVKDLIMTGSSSPASNDSPAAPAQSSLPLNKLGSLEVNLSFEVGEIDISLGELERVRPGYVFELNEPLNKSQVRIMAHGNVLGRGHLIAVGDRLGVRVSDFAPGSDD